MATFKIMQKFQAVSTRDYMKVTTQRIVSTTVFTLPAKNYPIFLLILLFNIAAIQAWNKLKSYQKAFISKQILSAIKSNE